MHKSVTHHGRQTKRKIKNILFVAHYLFIREQIMHVSFYWFWFIRIALNKKKSVTKFKNHIKVTSKVSFYFRQHNKKMLANRK